MPPWKTKYHTVGFFCFVLFVFNSLNTLSIAKLALAWGAEQDFVLASTSR